jgi:ABC-type lipopolysaccharide export system ATPase subunit
MAVIEVDHLTKDYGHGRGVFDVSFQVGEGEVFGYLGPNGAERRWKDNDNTALDGFRQSAKRLR